MTMTRDEKLKHLKDVANEGILLRKSVIETLSEKIIETADFISGVIGSGGKLLIAGNGGSAADAAHWAGEMVVRLTAERSRQALPALALNVDPAVMTAAANDFGYENIFARQVEAIGRKGDMFIAISTSGNSPNLINAARTAKEKGLLTFGLLGNKGGQLASVVDRALVIPHPSTQRIQEEHAFVIHTLVELVESVLFQ
jgi:D-sedoheptulose 7-phosphate isomerase